MRALAYAAGIYWDDLVQAAVDVRRLEQNDATSNPRTLEPKYFKRGVRVKSAAPFALGPILALVVGCGGSVELTNLGADKDALANELPP
jgi:hypothetical protein